MRSSFREVLVPFGIPDLPKIPVFEVFYPAGSIVKLHKPKDQNPLNLKHYEGDTMPKAREHSIRVRAFQHSPSEPLGFFEQIFSEQEIPFDYVRVWDDRPVTSGDATHLVFLGGPMSVNDEEELPWLKDEKKLIRHAVQQGIPVLGLCLGAQLIASAHGASVYKCINETGWYPVHPTPDATGVFASFPDPYHVFQMHGETFHLPAGGIPPVPGRAGEKPGVPPRVSSRSPVPSRNDRRSDPGLDVWGKQTHQRKNQARY